MPFIGALRSDIFSSKTVSAAVVAAFLFFVGLFSAVNTQAATYIVTRIDDRNLVCNSGVDCSLREAVAAANASAAVADTITFAIPPASCAPMTLVCTITLAGPEIAIQGAGGPLAIIGTGPDLLTIDGGIGPNRIFFSNTATLTIADMKLIGGNANVTGFGGAVSIFRGTATIDTVHFTGNSVPGSVGGALQIQEGSGHLLVNSTISGNSALFCGGIYAAATAMTIQNSTFSGNTATSSGAGGVCAENSIIAIRSTTIYNNTTNNQGGGISANAASAVSLQNTIVAGNSAVGTSDDIFTAPGAVLSTLGHNLIGSNEGVAAIFPAGNPNLNNDIVGTVASPVNPMLDVLNTYIGPNHIPTHVPLSSSPVLDKGNSFGLTTDQRGYMRPIDYPGVSSAPGGDGADIGSVEQLAPSAAGVTVGGRVLTSEGKPVAGAFITLTDASGSTVTSISSSFGFYQFDSVPAGHGYWVRVRSKRFSFPSQFIVVDDNVTDLDIVANW